MKKMIVAAATAGAFFAPLVASPAEAAHVLPGAGFQAGVPREVFAASFSPGEKYVVARVTGRVNPRATVKRLMFHITLSCNGEHMKATQNVMRGSKVTLIARRVMKNPDGCTVRATSDLGAHTQDYITVTSSVSAYDTFMNATDETLYGSPIRVYKGQSLIPAAARAAVPPGPAYVNAYGNVKITSCNTPNGSSENGSAQMCAAIVRKGTAKVEIKLIGQQFDAYNRVCRTVLISRKVVKINKYIHHYTALLSGSFKRSGGSCGGDLRVRVQVKTLGKVPVVVHKGGTHVGFWR